MENLKKNIFIYGSILEEFNKNLSDKYPEINKLINNEKTFKNELVKISDSLTKVSKNENKKKN